jgi:hypothetical protein
MSCFNGERYFKSEEIAWLRYAWDLSAVEEMRADI